MSLRLVEAVHSVQQRENTGSLAQSIKKNNFVQKNSEIFYILSTKEI